MYNVYKLVTLHTAIISVNKYAEKVCTMPLCVAAITPITRYSISSVFNLKAFFVETSCNCLKKITKMYFCSNNEFHTKYHQCDQKDLKATSCDCFSAFGTSFTSDDDLYVFTSNISAWDFSLFESVLTPFLELYEKCNFATCQI